MQAEDKDERGLVHSNFHTNLRTQLEQYEGMRGLYLRSNCGLNTRVRISDFDARKEMSTLIFNESLQVKETHGDAMQLLSSKETVPTVASSTSVWGCKETQAPLTHERTGKEFRTETNKSNENPVFEEHSIAVLPNARKRGSSTAPYGDEEQVWRSPIVYDKTTVQTLGFKGRKKAHCHDSSSGVIRRPRRAVRNQSHMTSSKDQNYGYARVIHLFAHRFFSRDLHLSLVGLITQECFAMGRATKRERIHVIYVAWNLRATIVRSSNEPLEVPLEHSPNMRTRTTSDQRWFGTYRK
ncbi:hypothetical protein BJ508DRAFT_307324 [Ascobolus immersus RN42]|uniref:Uncharacterized protein n=1 Tax=Ascobolus immersus RN42 TaxID=1160509 RepID=A0A3N4I526_ASCIM|nr:hypothetical protein BJ508DRAFT_307324 [Ascobolus immersus RN42]